MNGDTLMGAVERLPWDRSPHPGTMLMWTLFGIGGCFAVAVVHDLVARKKRPRG